MSDSTQNNSVSKHSFLYFLGRGLPGLVNFFALSVYTRLLSPVEYGEYALVVATVMLLNMVFYQWIRLALIRFYHNCKSESDFSVLYSSIGIGFVASSILSVIVSVIYFVFNSKTKDVVELLLLGNILLWLEAFFETNLDYFRSNLLAKKYSYAFISKSVIAICVGSVLAYYKMGAVGLILAIIIADVVVCIIYFSPFIRVLARSFSHYDSSHFKTLVMYGLPLTASFAMSFIVNSSDRYFINYYLGEASTGYYSVGYDLARSTLWVIMTSINLASFPLAVRALDRGGPPEANVQLKANFLIMVAISLPAAIGMAVLATRISNIFIGKLYASQVALIIPFISIGTLIAGLKAFYVDQSFQLGKKTYLQMWSVLAAAVVNIVLNILWIPTIGIMGAVYSTVICFVISLIVGIVLSKKSFKMPVPYLDFIFILIASLVMGAAIMVSGLYLKQTAINLGLLVLIGMVVYSLILVVFGFPAKLSINIPGLRNRNKA